jgi:hypothetical protein
VRAISHSFSLDVYDNKQMTGSCYPLRNSVKLTMSANFVGFFVQLWVLFNVRTLNIICRMQKRVLNGGKIRK